MLPTPPAKQSYLLCSFQNTYFMNSLNKTEEESVWAEGVRRYGEADLDEPVQNQKDLQQEIEIEGSM